MSKIKGKECFYKYYFFEKTDIKRPYNDHIMVVIFEDVSITQELKTINKNIFLESSQDRPQK